jgi:plasmid maintenance system antidote protein VapI
MAAWKGGEGWTKYKIAAVLGVAAPTVDSIINVGKKADGA